MSSGSTSTGAGYTNKLFLYAEVDSPDGLEYSMTNEEVTVKLEKLLDTSEEIVEVQYYTHPLNSLQVSKVNLHHSEELVVVHREKRHRCHHSALQDDQIGSRRVQWKQTPGKLGDQNRLTKKRKIEKRRTIKQFIEYIQQKNFIGEVYDVFVKNCQDFASKIYDGFF